MSALAERTRVLAGTGWLTCLGITCAAVGLLSGINPSYGAAAAAGIAFAAIVIANTTVGLVLFTVLSFLDVLRSGGAGGSFMKIAGLLLFASWVASAATDSRRLTTSLLETSPVLVASCVALLAWSTISLAWAETASVALDGSYRLVLNLLLLPIVFGSVRRREHVVWMAAAFVLGAVISALYGFVVPTASTGAQAGRLTGAVGDANDQAAVLVEALALAVGLYGVLRARPLLKALAGIAVLASLAGVVNTLSRSGLIALGVVMVAGVFLGGQWRRWAVALLVVSAIGVGGYFVAIAPLSARQRVTSADTSGRSTIWKVGWRMATANLVKGVGADNFRVSAIHYLQAPGAVSRADLVVDAPKVAHNVYLEMLADLGVPGLLLFLGILGGSLAAAMRAAQTFHRSGQRDLELMSRCAALALVGFMASDFFLSSQFSKQLWLLVALGPTLLSVARSHVRDGNPASDTRPRLLT